MTKASFRKALVGYTLLGAIGVATLEGDIRLVLLVFLGGLAVKSYIAYWRNRIENSAELHGENDRDGASKS